MTTESPMRVIRNAARNWSVNRDSVNFSASRSNAASQNLDLLLKDEVLQGNRKVSVPNRSGSAPPSVDGSLASIRNLLSHKNLNSPGSSEDLRSIGEGCASEELLRSDPAYLAYYFSNASLNPRLPPPLVSQEIRRLVHHMGGMGENWGLLSFDDNRRGSLFSNHPLLSTHEEESEDDGSPRKAFDDNIDRNHSVFSAPSSSYKVRPKSLVDLIQEDFPRTPSPIYHNQHRTATHNSAEGADLDVSVNRFIDYSNDLRSSDDYSAVSIPFSSSSNTSPTPHHGHDRDMNMNEINMGKVGMVGGDSDLNTSVINTETKDPRISHSGGPRGRYPRQNLQQSGSNKKGSSQSHIGQTQIFPPVTRLSAAEAQPVLQSTGIASPQYSTTSPYGIPYYPNLQPPSLYAPQYGIGGYALPSPIISPFVSGYSSQGSIPMPLDNNSANTNFDPRNSVNASSGSVPPVVDLQTFYKFYSHLGVAMQPSFSDPMYMNYFPHPSLNMYSGVSQYDTMVVRGMPVGSTPEILDSPKGPMPSSSSPDQRSQYHRLGVSSPSTRKVESVAPNYYGSSTPSIGFVMQYPTSPLGSPVYHGSLPAGTGYSGRRNDNIRSPFRIGRNTGSSPGWQGQRGRERADDLKFPSFLEEFKSNKGRRFELSEIAGRIVEFSSDQHGSRFIQQKLESCSAEEKASVFEEVFSHASKLMTDVFGNYVIQKFFEHGSPDQKKKLADRLIGHVLPLSLQMYGCRVIQKALEVIELEQKALLVKELDGHVMRCVRDQNGNHVIQKCIECVPTEKIGFIISAFHGQVATLSTHPYGCRVIQRVLEHCTDELQSQCIIDEILQSACVLAQDQYGNYVTQHVLERGKPNERSQIIGKLAGQIVQMSQNKFASNVIEKCLQFGDNAEKEVLIDEIVGQTEGNDNLLAMMKDQFANYVVQKILETCSEKQREILLNRIRVHIQALKKYTYGKHIVARVEQLCGGESSPSETC